MAEPIQLFDSGFVNFLVSAIAARLAIAAILTASASSLLAILTRLAPLNEVCNRVVKVTRDAATNAVYATRTHTNYPLRRVRNRTYRIGCRHRRMPKRAPEPTE